MPGGNVVYLEISSRIAAINNKQSHLISKDGKIII
jgi:hypothetical protein